jgi:general stress protein YciG
MTEQEKPPAGQPEVTRDADPAAEAPQGKRRGGGFAANRERASLAGKRGAETVKERLGTEHFQRLGKIGGAAVKKKYGPEYYREIGKRGGRSRWDAEKARGKSEGSGGPDAGS